MLTIIACPTVAKERVDEVRSAMLELVEATLKEPGCLRYELHQDNDNPNVFMFVETWESRELWRAHMDGEAIASFNKKISGSIDDFWVKEMTCIS